MSNLTTPLGDGEPHVVYLPGLDGSGILSSQFLVGAESLFPITRLNYPGHARLDLSEMADGCVQALAERGIDSAVWLGDSFGAAVAIAIAQRHPRATSGLILSGGFSRGPRASRLLLAARMWDRSPQSWRQAYLRNRLLRLARKNPSRISRSTIDELIANGQFEFLSWRLRLLASFNARPYLHRIRVPFLYLGGEDDTLVDTQEEAMHFRECVAGAKTFLFPGCGHLVLAERPFECLELTNAFIPLAKRVAA